MRCRGEPVVRTLGRLLIVCAALAVVKAAIIALLIVFGISLIWGLCAHPQEIFGFLALCALFSLVSAYPLLSLSTLGVLLVAAHLANRGVNDPQREQRPD